MASLSVVGDDGVTEVQLSAASLDAVLCRAAE
jgi:DtxR family Mn-dependent transcriptional regulator